MPQRARFFAPCLLGLLTLSTFTAISSCAGPRSRGRTARTDESPAESVPETGLASAPAPLLGDDPSVDEYVRHALARHAGLRAAFERWRAQSHRAPQLTALPEPRLTYAHFIESIETRTGPQRNRFALSQTFPWFGKLGLRGEIADADAAALVHEIEATRLSVARDVKVAYFEYAYLARAAEIARASLELLRRLEPIVQRRVQTGGDQGDALRLQVEIGKVENDLLSLERIRPALSARLAAALNRDDDALLPRPPPFEAEIVEIDPVALRDRLEEANPRLLAMARTVEREARREDLADLDRYPEFTVGAEVFETGSARNPSTPGSGDDPVALSLSITLPLWSGKYSAAASEARAARMAARDAETQARHDLRAALETRIYELDEARRQIGLYRDSLIPRARQSLEVAQASYRAGTATLIEVIDSERVLLEFEKAYFRAQSRYEQSLAEIEVLCGGEVR